MRKFLLTLLFFIVLILFVPYTFVMLIQPSMIPPAADSEQNQSSAQEPIASITSYIPSTDQVITMDFSEYLKGVVAAEMPASFYEEALKAQAVAARSYILTRLKGYERDGAPAEHKGAMTCSDPTHCKAWLSKEDLQGRWGADYDQNWNKISQCVEATKGIVMTYDGKLVNAVFHSTSSGHTENAKDVWGGNIPYLVSVSSPGDSLSPKYESSKTMTLDSFRQTIQAAHADAVWNEQEELISNIVRSDAGGILSLTTGGIELTGSELRSLFSLNSTNVDFQINETEITMHVKGNGHGVGMSQYGANYLASTGMTYPDILKTYYTGVNVGIYQGEGI